MNLSCLKTVLFLFCSACGAFEPEFVQYSNEQIQSVDGCEESINHFEANLLTDLSNSCTACHSESSSASNFSFNDKSSDEIVNQLVSKGSNWNYTSWLSSSSHYGSSTFIDISSKWENWLSIQNSCE